jgi:hypothetical protein
MAGADLTSWVTSGYKTEPLPPGSWVTITLRVQVGADVPVGRVRDIRIHVRSFYSSQVRDVVVAEVVVV